MKTGLVRYSQTSAKTSDHILAQGAVAFIESKETLRYSASFTRETLQIIVQLTILYWVNRPQHFLSEHTYDQGRWDLDQWDSTDKKALLRIFMIFRY